jgi:hypothetical protein
MPASFPTLYKIFAVLSQTEFGPTDNGSGWGGLRRPSNVPDCFEDHAGGICNGTMKRASGRRPLGTRKGKTAIMPITDEYIERMAGVTGTKGRLLKALKEEKAKERPNPSRDGK